MTIEYVEWTAADAAEWERINADITTSTSPAAEHCGLDSGRCFA